jgi:hypothetical protein
VADLKNGLPVGLNVLKTAKSLIVLSVQLKDFRRLQLMVTTIGLEGGATTNVIRSMLKTHAHRPSPIFKLYLRYFLRRMNNEGIKPYSLVKKDDLDLADWNDITDEAFTALPYYDVFATIKEAEDVPIMNAFSIIFHGADTKKDNQAPDPFSNDQLELVYSMLALKDLDQIIEDAGANKGPANIAIKEQFTIRGYQGAFEVEGIWVPYLPKAYLAVESALADDEFGGDFNAAMPKEAFLAGIAALSIVGYYFDMLVTEKVMNNKGKKFNGKRLTDRNELSVAWFLS